MVKRDSEARRVVLVRQEYIEQVAPEESAENSVWWFYGWLKGKLLRNCSLPNQATASALKIGPQGDLINSYVR
jgi:hypothetical protein